MDLEEKIKLKPRTNSETAGKIAREIMEKYETVFLKKYVIEAGVPREDVTEALMLAKELLEPSDGDEALRSYRKEWEKMISRSVEKAMEGKKRFIPMGAVNFLCGEYRREIKAVAAASAELIARERHGDLCCLIAGEYIERRMHHLGSKLIAVHLVIDRDGMSLYNGRWQEITDEYSAYIPEEDRIRYSRSDLVLSAMVDIAPRSIYVYGGENNLKMLRRVQLMFSGVKMG